MLADNGDLELQCNTDLERELYRRNVELFTRYNNMRKSLCENYYQYIDYQCPWFTDHGIKHCDQIIKFASDMLSKHLTHVHAKRGIPVSTNFSLSNHDIFVLLSAILWHDIGMLLGREDHSTEIIEFQSKINQFVADIECSMSIVNVAAAHSSNHYFHKCKLTNMFNLPNNNIACVQEKLLASVLRLSDEVSETKYRVSTCEDVIKNIPPQNLIFWEHAKSISLSHYNIDEEGIEITYKIPTTVAFQEYEIKTKDGNVSKIDFYKFVVSRICKVYRELELCAPFFKDFISVTKYQVSITFIHKDSKTGAIKESSSIEKNINFLGYTKDSLDTLRNFFSYYPEFDPINVNNLLTNFLRGVKNVC